MKENSRFFSGFSLLYGILFAFFCYKNVSGIAFLGQIIVTIAFSRLFLKKINPQICFRKTTLLYEIGIFLLGISTIRTDSQFIIFFNWVGIILLFLAEMIKCFCSEEDWEFFTYIKNMIIMAFRSLGYSVHIFLWKRKSLNSSESTDKSKKNRITKSVILGTISAVTILVMIIPLLISSDMIFAKMISNIFYVPITINFDNIFLFFIMMTIGTLLFYGSFYAFSYHFCKTKVERNVPYFSYISGIIFTGMIAIVYVFYCAVQIIYLFFKAKGGLPDGVTYSEYAREGFWQLLFVAMINFILVLSCMYLFQKNKILQKILTVICGCTFIMIISAMYRILLYIKEYHMTFLRILVLWFLILLIIMMAGIVISIYRIKFPLFRYIMITCTAGYIFLSFLRPDFVSSAYNIQHMEKITYRDACYMIHSSSYDAASALYKIDIDKIEYEYPLYEKMELKMQLEEYFKNAHLEMENSSVRQFNFSRWNASLLFYSFR